MSRRLTGGAFAVALVSALVAGGGVVRVAAQKNPYRNYTEQKFVENMQSAARNVAAVNDLIARAEYEDAKAQLTRAREQLAITVQFWRDLHREDAAIAMLRNALTGMDDLDKALGAKPVDPAGLKAITGRIAAACQACHAVYRDQDPATKTYRVKPGSVR